MNSGGMIDTDRPVQCFRVVIYGFTGTSAAGWFSVEPVSGRLWCYRELVESDAAPGAFARRVVQQEPDGRFTKTLANPEVFRDGKDAGGVSEVFTAQGLYCQLPEPDRETAIAKLQDYVEERWILQPDGTEVHSKLLVVTRDCPRLAEAARRALRDTEDACALVLAYACACRPSREARLVDPAVRRMELAEQATWAREQARREHDDGHGRRRRY